MGGQELGEQKRTLVIGVIVTVCLCSMTLDEEPPVGGSVGWRFGGGGVSEAVSKASFWAFSSAKIVRQLAERLVQETHLEQASRRGFFRPFLDHLCRREGGLRRQTRDSRQCLDGSCQGSAERVREGCLEVRRHLAQIFLREIRGQQLLVFDVRVSPSVGGWAGAEPFPLPLEPAPPSSV